MSEGMEGQTPSPETRQTNPTEASKGFLKRAGRKLSDIGIEYLTPDGRLAMDFIRLARNAEKAKKPTAITASQKIEQPISSEIKQPSPTEASKGFLEREIQRIGKWPFILPVATMVALRLAGEPATLDIAQGDYRSAAIKGVVAGLSLAPLVYKTFKGR